MIKLIASDMDGTLLNDKKQLPDDFYEVLDKLDEKGIHFTISSGRTYAAVEHLFHADYRRKMDYICDNGACVIHKGVPVYECALERGVFEKLLAACESIGGLRVLVCAKKGTYHLRYDEKFDAEVEKFYANHIITDDLYSIDDTIYKLAVCDYAGTMEHAKPAIDAIFGDKLNVQVSGKIWMDVMGAGVSKGAALKALSQQIGAERDEIMAFGDYFNDTDMLLAAGWSFAMENGHEEIKKICRFAAQSNNDNGVTKAIRQYVLGEITE